MTAVTAETDQPVYLQWALHYLSRGWSVVPVAPGSKVPSIKWADYAKRLPTVEEVRGWWREQPKAHVGIVTGAVSGFFVVDEDVKDLGDDTLRDLEIKHGDLPETMTCLTGGGGRHLFFKHPGAAVKTGKGILGPGVDIRGDGGFVVAHPSLHSNGRHYQWEADLGPGEVEIANAPAWVIRALESPLGDETGQVVDIQRDGLNRVQDGREQFARDMVWAAAHAFLKDGRELTAGGLFYDVWPQYERMAKPRGGGTLEDEGRGESMVWHKCEAAIAKLAGATPQPRVTETAAPEPVSEDLGKPTLVEPFGTATIPPRQWLLGTRLVLKYVSVIGSPPGVGKTAITTAAALAVASGRDDITGDKVWERGPVWVLNLEDDRDEMRRRIAAAMVHHDIPWEAVKGRVYMDSGRDSRFVIAKHNKQNQVVEATPLHAAIVKHIRDLGIKLVIVDPYKRSYEGEENDNSVQDRLMELWTAVADAAGCAIWLVHHFRKGGQGGDLDAFRGGGGLGGGVRVAETVMPMTAEEAERLLPGDQQDRRLQYLRLDSAKANLAPRGADARWFRLNSIGLDNGDATYVNGDHVQAAAPWTPPSMWEQISKHQIVELLMQVNEALDAGAPFKPGTRSNKRLDQHMEQALSIPAAAARAMIRAWEDAGMLERKKIQDEFRKLVSAYHAPNPHSVMEQS